MVGSLFSSMVVGLLVAQSPGDFSFEGRQVSARTRSQVGFFAQGAVPFPTLWERGQGSATLTVRERVVAPGATYGDDATFDARFRLGASEFQVELLHVGFPPPQASGAAAAGPLPQPGHPIGGGVLLDTPLYGNSGLGWQATTRVHAAAALWGVGRVSLNGRPLTDSAVIHVSALSHGAQADDETHLTLAQAREGDTELHVLVWNLPLSAEPRGFIHFSFDDVEIEFGGVALKSVAVVPTLPGQMDPNLATPQLGLVVPGTPLAPPTRPGEGVGGSGFDFTQPSETGVPGGPVSTVSPGTISGPGSADPLVIPGVDVGTRGATSGTAAPGVPGVPSAEAVSPAVTVGPGAVTPDTFSGTFPTVGAPTPPANISGFLPGTPPPGSDAATQIALPGAPPPGGPAEAGAALRPNNQAVSTQGSFSVVGISPPNFSTFVGTTQVSPGIIATPPPITSDPATPTPALLGSPAPLTAAPAPPLLGTPAPLNAAPAPALVGTPPPINAAPGATTLTPIPPASGTPLPGGVASPGGTGVPPSI